MTNGGLSGVRYYDSGHNVTCTGTVVYGNDGSCPFYTGTGKTWDEAETVFPYCEVQTSATQSVEQPKRIGDFNYVCAAAPAPPPPPASPPPPPPPPPDPPLGCAYGAGGFKACITDTGVPPSSNPPVGTPVNGGPGPNIGSSSDGPVGATQISDPTNVDGSADTCKKAAGSVGDPVFPATGNVYEAELDYAGPNGLHVVRRYNSALPGWVHNFGMRVLSTSTRALVVRPDGAAFTFTGNGPGLWTSEAGTRDQLIRLDPADPTQPLWQYITEQDTSEYYDSQGRLVSFTLRGGRSYFVQRSGAFITAVSDQFGHSLQYGYDASNRLSYVTTPEGPSITYSYDEQGRLAAVNFPDRTARSYLYENSSYPLGMTGVIDERGVRVSSWTYDAQGRAVGSERAGALRYAFQYNADGSATYYDPLGATRTQAYAAAGARKVFAGQSQPCADCSADAASNTVDTATGLITSSTDFLGVTTLFSIDAARKLPTAITKAANHPEAQTVQVQWHPSLHVPLFVTEAGRSTAYSYDGAGNMLARTVTDTASGEARKSQWTYTPQGLVSTYTDPRGATWTYSYDAGGNRTSVKDPLERESRFTYDAAGRVTSQTDPGGLVTTYAYDLRGRLASLTRGGEASTFVYTPSSQLATASLPDGYSVSYTYDGAQRLVAATDNRGSSVQYTLDGMGNRTSEQVKDANGNIAFTTTRVITSLNRIAALQGSLGQTTAFSYDANGQLTAATDPLNQTTRSTLDALGRTTATTFADNTSATQAWSALDALARVTDPKGVATQFERNAFGEVVRETSPDIGSVSYERDAAGNVVATTDAKGNTARITRDALGRVVQIAYSDQTQSFSYDAAGNVARIDDGSGSTVYTRDALGRVLSKTQTVNDVASSPTQRQVQYTYTAGDLTGMQYPSGLRIEFKRSAGRVVQVDAQPPASASRKAAGPVTLLKDITYTALGQPKSWSWFNGDSASRTFDADGRMTANEFASYGWDSASRITSITQNLWANAGASTASPQLAQTPITWSVGYDSRNRLTSMTRAGQKVSFWYDGNGNRVSRTQFDTSDVDLEGQFDAPGFSLTTSETPQVDAGSNRLLGFSVTATSRNGSQTSTTSSQVNYAVDANGAMTSDGLRTFVYDASARLSKVQATQGDSTVGVEYLHNALGQRVFKSDPVGEGSSYTSGAFGDGFIGWLKANFGWLFTPGRNRDRLGLVFTYDEQGSLIAAYSDGSSAANAQQMDIVWLPLEDGTSIPVGVYKAGQFYAVHSDNLGTPRLITDSTKTAVWQWPYSAFGNNKPTGVLQTVPANGTTAGGMLKATNPGIEFNLRFPGQYFDSESGLAYNAFRSMGPVDGRYTQADPIGLSAGLNRFAYGSGSPLTRIDPLGLADFLERCKGRYAACSATQDTQASPIVGTVGNWIKFEVCKTAIDRACRSAGTFCDEEESRQCYADAVAQGKSTAQCTVQDFKFQLQKK